LKDAYFKQDPEVITRFILSMIVLANLPLSFVEHFVFKTFLALVVPWYEVPSRTTVAFCFFSFEHISLKMTMFCSQFARRLEQAFELCQSDVVAATGKQEFISVTLNTATVVNTSKHYMIFTVHYFGKNFCHKT